MSLVGVTRLTGHLQHYAWGAPDAIARLRGTEPSGTPEAELWFGAHPSAPSTADGVPLDAAIAADPQLVGAASASRFGPRLPYLLKLLAAAQPLSLQAHPSRRQAEEGFAREEAAGVPRGAAVRNYTDDWPKPEMLVALDPTQALCGFRPAAESAAIFARFGLAELDALTGPLREPDESTGIRQTFLAFLRLGREARGLVERVAADAAGGGGSDPAYGQACATAVEVNRHHPGDPGVLAALLMNRIELTRFDGIFLPAGNLHAYLRGFGVEIMANSDNVLRGGLTPKHVDVEELAAVVDFSPGRPDLVRIDDHAPGVARYVTPAPEFALWRIGGAPASLPGTDAGRIALAVEPVTLAANDNAVALRPGEAAFLPAGLAATATGEGTFFLAAPGVRTQ